LMAGGVHDEVFVDGAGAQDFIDKQVNKEALQIRWERKERYCWQQGNDQEKIYRYGEAAYGCG